MGAQWVHATGRPQVRVAAERSRGAHLNDWSSWLTSMNFQAALPDTSKCSVSSGSEALTGTCGAGGRVDG